jgi:hypothetical protein
MASKEQAVRDAAVALKTAIADATAAGYRIVWPANATELEQIAISATGAVVEDAAEGAKPQSFGVREPAA